MNRKQFLVRLGTASLAGAAAPLLRAQTSSEYRTLSGPIPTDAGPGRIEVIEFFWFSCPHCYALEPALEAWAARLPADVVLRREHVPSREARHQQLYFALQAIGADRPEVMHAVFDAYHKGGKRMNDLKEITPVVAAAGVDPKLFEDAFNSFGVRAKVQQANKLSDQYGIDGVPALAVNGRYVTSPAQAGGNEAALRVVDALIARERKGTKS